MKNDSRESSEAAIQKAIMEFLALHQITHWRVPVGPVLHRFVDRKTNRVVAFNKRNPMRGFPDLAGILEKKHRGVFFALEIKTAKGRPSKDQLRWIGTIRKSGGIAEIVRSVQEVETLMRHLGEIENR